MGAEADHRLRARDLTATITVHVVPRARTSEVAGSHGDAVKVRLAAPPVDGAANDELVRFLAERLGVPRRSVTITAGHTGRRKTVKIEGMETEKVLEVLRPDPSAKAAARPRHAS